MAKFLQERKKKKILTLQSRILPFPAAAVLSQFYRSLALSELPLFPAPMEINRAP